MARGWVILPSMRVLRVCEAFSSRATLMLFLGPSSVQYRLSAIQSTAIPSTVWIPEHGHHTWPTEDIKDKHFGSVFQKQKQKTFPQKIHNVLKWPPWYSTFLEDGVPLRAIDLLPADEEAGGVGKVDELALGVEVQCPGVHQVLDGDHVLVGHLGIHVHAPDNPRTTFTVDQEELVLWF